MDQRGREIAKTIVLSGFYVEGRSKAELARLSGLSRNTVKKYLMQNPPETSEVRAMIERYKNPASKTDPLENFQYKFNYLQGLFPDLVEKEFKRDDQSNVLVVARNHGLDLGIDNMSDWLKLEIAYENLIYYRTFCRRIVKFNSGHYDQSLVKSEAIASKMVCNYSQAAQKFLSNHLTMIKELEIRYGKRSISFDRLRTLNILKNEINF
jgi:hypothetical protein